jgi:hypothetical protein
MNLPGLYSGTLMVIKLKDLAGSCLAMGQYQ